MEGQKFKPTREWLTEKYDQFNQELFNGELGSCNLQAFTSGRGSRGGRLGYFTTGNTRLGIDNETGQMLDKYTKKKVTSENFVEMFQPVIAVNANYTWTEEVLENTLIHEMCHYYTYKDGYCPRQGHGPEFRYIASRVAQLSNGRFNIQRLATAEEMSNLELDTDIKTANQRRLAKKKSNMTAVLVYMDNHDVQLTLTTSQKLVDQIVNANKERSRGYDSYSNFRPVKILTCSDPAFIDKLFSLGYKQSMRTYRYWNVGDKVWANAVETSYDVNVELRESKARSLSVIVEEVVNSFLNNEFDDLIPITPGMDLGALSPFEYYS